MSVLRKTLNKRNASIIVLVLLAAAFFTRLPSANALSRWDAVSLPPGTPQLTGVAMTSVNDGWAVGLNRAILRWDGTAWNTWVQDPPPTPPPQPHLFSVTMVDANDGWAVGWGWIVHWDGTAWTSVACPTSMIISSISMLGADDGWAVGQSGTIVHYHDGEWSSVTSPTTSSLYTISMISATDGWAVGDAGTIIHWDGSSWAGAASPTTSGLYSLLMTGATDGWIGGASGLLLRWDGSAWTQWSQDHPPVADHIYGISMVNPDDVWAVGASATLLHWNGVKWSNAPNPTTRSLKFISMVDGIDGWAVGGEGSGVAIRDAPAESLSMTVSYEVVGDGVGYSAPVFRYSEGGVWQDVELTTTPTVYSADAGTTWFVLTNPLDGSTGSERWFSSQELSGTPSGQTLVFSFQHQFYLAMSVTMGGGVSPGSTWFDAGSSVEISASAVPGYVFVRWEGTGSDSYTGTDNTANIIMNEAITETAYLSPAPPVQHDLTISMSPSEAGTTNPAGGVHSYDEGTPASVTATALGGYVFDHWVLDTVDVGSDNPYTVTMDAAHALEAVFAAAPPVQYDLTISVSPIGSGVVNLDNAGPYHYGDVVQFTAVPNDGWSFSAWSGDLSGSVNPDTLTITGDESVTATFTQKTYNLIFMIIGDGVVNLDNAGPYHYGDVLQVTAVPNDGWSFSTWRGDLSGNTNPNVITFDSDKAVSVIFTRNTYGLTISASPSGAGSTDPAAGVHSYNEGAEVPVTPTASSGYVFDHWVLDGSDVGSGDPSTHAYTATMDRAHALEAVFVATLPTTVQITIESSPEESLGDIAVDSNPVTTPAQFTWDVGATPTLAASTTAGCGSGCQYVFVSWTSPSIGTVTSASFTYTVPATDETVTANYQQQYYLTMQVNPAGAGSTLPVSGWQNAGETVSITPIANPGYAFHSWTGSGSGSGSYTGTDNPGSITIDGPISETAEFRIIMTVSYSATGGSGYFAPTFNYVLEGAAMTYTLTGTPTDVQVDATSAWSVTPNPLVGSGPNEQWHSSQTLSGIAAPGTYTFNFDHQYYLTMRSNPSTDRGLSPVSGWFSEASSVEIHVAPISGYNFVGWNGAGNGSYSGTDNPGSITMNGPITEDADFEPATPVIMAVSYKIMGGGSGYFAPTFNYVLGGIERQYSMTHNRDEIWVDYGSSWSITPNPLDGSTSNEQWWCDQPLSGTAQSGSYVFTFTHQYNILVSTDPPSGGTASPSSGWQNAGELDLKATSGNGYTFLNWEGSGSGSYSGTDSDVTITLESSISEIAHFQTEPVTLTVSYNIIGGGSGYTAPVFHYVQNGVEEQYELTTTPTDVQIDAYTDWHVTPNPLGGSGLDEQWLSIGTLSGTSDSTPESWVFHFTRQYYLTMQVNPPDSGSTEPISTWGDAGSTGWIIAIPANGYMLASWTGTGSGSYSGQSDIAQVTLNGPITEVANFETATTVTMTVSFASVGGGSGYSQPILSYVQGGVNKQYTLTGTPTDIEVDGGTPWTVTPNPLTGSGSSERWYSAQPLSGTAAAGTYLFTFQNQYLLTMASSPSGGGTTTPSTSWQNAGTAVNLSAVANSDYTFSAWVGSGTGSYAGTANPTGITVAAPVTEVAYFEHHAPPLQTYLIVANTNPAGLDNPQGGGEYVHGATITISVSDVSGYTFQKWQRDGVDFTEEQSFEYTVDGTHIFTATFENDQPPLPGQVSILITSDPAGSGLVSVDDTIISTPQLFNWDAGSAHTVAAVSPTNGEQGVRYVWVGWSDGGTQTHTITVSTTAAITYTASFKTQYLLTVAVSPEGTGTADPGVGQHWYDAGTIMEIHVQPGSSYHFQSWTGVGSGYSGTDNPATVTMENPITERAVLSQSQPASPCIIATAAYGSPMNPEVAYMRYVRDNMIGSTPTGHGLRDGWNWFYYLWSPPIAAAISGNPTLQATFRVLLLPLVGIIHTTGWVFTALGGSDIASVIAFITAAMMSTTVYIIAPAMAIRLSWKHVRKRE